MENLPGTRVFVTKKLKWTKIKLFIIYYLTKSELTIKLTNKKSNEIVINR